MATVNPLPGAATAPVRTETRLLVLLATLQQEKLVSVLDKLAACMAPEELLIATSDETAKTARPDLQIVTASSSKSTWTVTAADYVSAFELAQQHNAGAVLMLGPECDSLSLQSLRNLANTLVSTGSDLVMPHYDLPPRAGLVNSAILYPLSRALFASPARFPLAVDFGLSIRLAERLAVAGQRFIQLNQPNALLWPVNEAAAAGLIIREVDAGHRTLPQPTEPDLNAILPLIAGSLFADIETKAAFWQRARQLPANHNHHASEPDPSADGATDIAPMLQAFRLAYTNLQEIWSLVLPPNALLGLKRLSLTDGPAFRMPESLWARVVYDFVLAYRQRTINRGHLLGALIPLYLA